MVVVVSLSCFVSFSCHRVLLASSYLRFSCFRIDVLLIVDFFAHYPDGAMISQAPCLYNVGSAPQLSSSNPDGLTRYPGVTSPQAILRTFDWIGFYGFVRSERVFGSGSRHMGLDVLGCIIIGTIAAGEGQRGGQGRGEREGGLVQSSSTRRATGFFSASPGVIAAWSRVEVPFALAHTTHIRIEDYQSYATKQRAFLGVEPCTMDIYSIL